MWQVLLIPLLILLLIDWYQTYQISLHPDRWYETNQILGQHPKPLTVHIYFLIVIACACFLVAKIPEPWNYIAATGFSLIELWYVIGNKRLGIA